MVAKFYPYGALMINRGNRILIVFHLYCCSKHKLSDDTHGECCEPCLFCHVNILVQNVIQFLFYLYTLDMIGLPLWDIILPLPLWDIIIIITIMGYYYYHYCCNNL